MEIGAGVGANFAHLARAGTVVAIEPNRAMHRSLEQRARDHGVDLEIVATGAERLPLPDASVDEVLCSLVLCTVADPAATLSEIRRV
ncbi:MAG: class I SAM-dependent methyltransferase, partial [Acidimicrobiales bacterium]